MKAHKDLGFTLMELMVVVLIISILAGIAIPSYQKMMQRSRRAEAATIISDQQLRLEKYRVDHASYGDYWGDAAAPKGDTSTPFYDITVSAGDATSYTITAEALGSQAGDGCGDLSLTFDAGEVTKDPDPTSTECW